MNPAPRPLVFLIGYRGAGKSTIARSLARRLGWDWVDADDFLERAAGKTIQQIFAAEGEASFRAREAAILSQLADRERLVVATGGGVILREENRRRLGQGFVAWLIADAPTLWRRLGDDASTAQRRPNLAQGGLAEIEDLLRARSPLYEICADLKVDASRSPEQITEEIFAGYQNARTLPSQTES